MTDTNHDMTIELDDDLDAYVLACTCPDTSPTEHYTYRSAFSAGLAHWTKTAKGS